MVLVVDLDVVLLMGFLNEFGGDLISAGCGAAGAFLMNREFEGFGGSGKLVVDDEEADDGFLKTNLLFLRVLFYRFFSYKFKFENLLSFGHFRLGLNALSQAISSGFIFVVFLDSIRF